MARPSSVTASGLLLIFMAILGLGRSPEPTTARVLAQGEAVPMAPPDAHPGGQLDLNLADRRALEALPRVGPTIAGHILAERARRGGRFTELEDLLKVRGIGPRTLEALRRHVRIDGAPPRP